MIFSAFKGFTYESQREGLTHVMEQLDFTSSNHVMASVLSGGQKRKLAVLMALIGDPQILMLDEPTSGLDVAARQKVWDVVKSRKQSIITLMTTHYMDEAEELGDRIAIMADGEIKCCGSPLFLKKLLWHWVQADSRQGGGRGRRFEFEGVDTKSYLDRRTQGADPYGGGVQAGIQAAKQFPRTFR